jgi:hypothetical protein
VQKTAGGAAIANDIDLGMRQELRRARRLQREAHQALLGVGGVFDAHGMHRSAAVAHRGETLRFVFHHRVPRRHDEADFLLPGVHEIFVD